MRPADIGANALGAAYAAGYAVGVGTEEDIFILEQEVVMQLLSS